MPMFFSKGAIKNFFYLHQRFKENRDYRLSYLIRCSLNVIKHERIVKHDGKYMINAFLPPVNSEAFFSIAKNVPGEGKEFYTNHVKGMRLAPISTYVAVTKRCMYQCWHCSASEMMGQKQEDLKTSDVIRIVKDLQNLGVGIIGFTGGEPLIRQDLEVILSAIDERSMTLLFSNGYGLTKERAISLKQAGLFGVAISIDSIIPEKHDAKRGYKGAYQIALEAIENARKAQLYTMGQVVCTRELLETGEIHELAKFLKKQGIHELRIVEPIPCGSLESQQEAILTEEEQKQLIELHILFNAHKEYPKTSVFSYVESAQQYGCGAGVQHSYIDYEGNFRACDFIYESYGNVLSESIEEIWKRMHHSSGGPKCGCYAKKRCSLCKGNQVPHYYRLLGGEKINSI
ncbi:radical SAM protein [Sporanaerobium hydrogeniformans]|uniref:Radical SAM protein n=2 Tax=Sporanaerobium hydrogeniformans TaxID=3072179 RepID=A0AC61DEC2_9FIRM|nr:radical SAM protein [Sporanaerobium hydrogeniformans]